MSIFLLLMADKLPRPPLPLVNKLRRFDLHLITGVVLLLMLLCHFGVSQPALSVRIYQDFAEFLFVARDNLVILLRCSAGRGGKKSEKRRRFFKGFLMWGTRGGFLAAASLKQMPHLNGNPAKLVFHSNPVKHSASLPTPFYSFHRRNYRHKLNKTQQKKTRNVSLFALAAAPLGRPNPNLKFSKFHRLKTETVGICSIRISAYC